MFETAVSWLVADEQLIIVEERGKAAGPTQSAVSFAVAASLHASSDHKSRFNMYCIVCYAKAIWGSAG